MWWNQAMPESLSSVCFINKCFFLKNLIIRIWQIIQAFRRSVNRLYWLVSQTPRAPSLVRSLLSTDLTFHKNYKRFIFKPTSSRRSLVYRVWSSTRAPRFNCSTCQVSDQFRLDYLMPWFNFFNCIDEKVLLRAPPREKVAVDRSSQWLARPIWFSWCWTPPRVKFKG
jgi:hypothetical protein